jgi:hypothetical protein
VYLDSCGISYVYGSLIHVSTIELKEFDVQAMLGSEVVDWAQALALKVFIRLENNVAVLEEAIPLE